MSSLRTDFPYQAPELDVEDDAFKMVVGGKPCEEDGKVLSKRDSSHGPTSARGAEDIGMHYFPLCHICDQTHEHAYRLYGTGINHIRTFNSIPFLHIIMATNTFITFR